MFVPAYYVLLSHNYIKCPDRVEGSRGSLLIRQLLRTPNIDTLISSRMAAFFTLRATTQ